MRTINDRLRKAQTEGHIFEDLINELNKRYNEWPHSSTNTTPFAALFRREPRLAIPSLTQEKLYDDAVRERERELQFERKIRNDTKKRAVESKIKAGDHVLARTEHSKKSKMSPEYADEIFRVLLRNGSELMLQPLDNTWSCCLRKRKSLHISNRRNASRTRAQASARIRDRQCHGWSDYPKNNSAR